MLRATSGFGIMVAGCVFLGSTAWSGEQNDKLDHPKELDSELRFALKMNQEIRETLGVSILVLAHLKNGDGQHLYSLQRLQETGELAELTLLEEVGLIEIGIYEGKDAGLSTDEVVLSYNNTRKGQTILEAIR